MDHEWLIRTAADYGIPLEETKAKEIAAYCDAVLETNKLFNLTAITEPAEMMEKNALDCLTVLPYLPGSGAVADVGTGAGFPGAIIRIVRPDLAVTLIEATDKKLRFVVRTLTEMGMEVNGVHLRGEEAARDIYREYFDAVTARAVASLPALLEYALPLVKTGGVLLAMKGAGAEDEIKAAQRALSILGGEVEEVRSLELPTAGERNIVVIRKVRETPARYPRPSKNIRKDPL